MKIVIDAGHGFTTAGKCCPDGSMKEYAFNRVAARYATEALLQHEGVEVRHTHSDDRDVPLIERTNAANAWGADLFVSIHANAMGNTWGKAAGIETFVYKLSLAGSVKVADVVHAEVVARTGLPNRGVKAGDFHVIRETKMDAILVESGFMDNPSEAALLKTEAYRKTVGEAIAAGIAKCYGLKPKAVVIPAPILVTPDPLAAVPEWALEAVKAGLAKGAITDPSGDHNFYRMIVVMHRLGLFN